MKVKKSAARCSLRSALLVGGRTKDFLAPCPAVADFTEKEAEKLLPADW
jgi:hypothetical protein